uniref:Uncharacterized protein n=1 Tax=Kalanchoe fedtschenkoi TaxID=63787 RepID=A0A7N0TI63_KALFE
MVVPKIHTRVKREVVKEVSLSIFREVVTNCRCCTAVSQQLHKIIDLIHRIVKVNIQVQNRAVVQGCNIRLVVIFIQAFIIMRFAHTFSVTREVIFLVITPRYMLMSIISLHIHLLCFSL